VNYTIIHVDDRAKNNIEKIKLKLKPFNYIDDILFFNGNTENAWDVLNHRKISTNSWNPYDGRTFGPTPGEYGIWVSTINCFNYMINNNLKNLLILEDDIILKDNFLNILNNSVNDLPKNYDFLSLHYFEEHNNIDDRTLIGSSFIHKSLNQYSGAQGILYSITGAKKILRAIQRKGIEYTCDCFIFKHSHIGALNGFTIRPDIDKIIIHDKNIKSSIDVNNLRKVEMYGQ
jgi:hypothetical protein